MRHYLTGKSLHRLERIPVIEVTEVEIENHFFDTSYFTFLECGNTCLRIAGDDTALAEILGFHTLQTRDDIGKVSDMRRGSSAVPRNGRGGQSRRSRAARRRS